VPWWGVVSSVAAPVLLVSGWMVAARLQPGSFDEISKTVSTLAGRGATDRWVMTLVFLAVGVCDVVTGIALRSATLAGRLTLVAGGMAGMLVAASPETTGGKSTVHAVWAAVGFLALTAWPIVATRRGPSVPWGLRPAVGVAAALATLLLLGWFALELITGLGQAGLAERILGEVQAGWPFVVVLSIRWFRMRTGRDRALQQDYRSRSLSGHRGSKR
jgi:Protein of unknown function (DUF998)